jgi:hypothetical protein
MKILLFSGTGMVGDGVLRWLIASPNAGRLVAVSRKPLAVQHPKLETVIELDMSHLQHVKTCAAVRQRKVSAHHYLTASFNGVSREGKIVTAAARPAVTSSLGCG